MNFFKRAYCKHMNCSCRYRKFINTFWPVRMLNCQNVVLLCTTIIILIIKFFWGGFRYLESESLKSKLQKVTKALILFDLILIFYSLISYFKLFLTLEIYFSDPDLKNIAVLWGYIFFHCLDVITHVYRLVR